MHNGITKEQIDALIKKNGKKTARLLSILGKQQQFYNAVSSPIGAELMNDVIGLMEAKLELIINETATEKDKAEYRVLKQIALTWSDKINDYLRNIEKVKSGQ